MRERVEGIEIAVANGGILRNDWGDRHDVRFVCLLCCAVLRKLAWGEVVQISSRTEERSVCWDTESAN